MIRTGLVSITFRKLTPREIVDLVRECGLEGIEWGGDVHAPHGDVAAAKAVAALTADAGLRVASYGSYYRVGVGEPCPFDDVVRSAVALGAPVIRVWAGKLGSAVADEAYREMVVRDAQRIAALAAAEGLTVAFEYHGNTLTDQPESARGLLEQVDRPNCKTYWQPLVGTTPEQNIDSIGRVADWLTHLHVFTWHDHDRRDLAEGEAAWRGYLERVNALGGERFAMLEFVRNDDPDQFRKDAATLKQWVGQL